MGAQQPAGVLQFQMFAHDPRIAASDSRGRLRHVDRTIGNAPRSGHARNSEPFPIPDGRLGRRSTSSSATEQRWLGLCTLSSFGERHKESRRTKFRSRSSRGEVAISRPCEAKVIPQRAAGIFLPEQAAPLEFGNQLVDHRVEPAGQPWKHHVETVRGICI